MLPARFCNKSIQETPIELRNCSDEKFTARRKGGQSHVGFRWALVR